MDKSRLCDYFIVVGAPSAPGSVLHPGEQDQEHLHPLDRSYRAELLHRYPLKDHRDCPIPPATPMFCFPSALHFVRAGGDIPVPRAHYFTATAGDADRLYGSVLVFYEPIEDGTAVELDRLYEQWLRTQRDSTPVLADRMTPVNSDSVAGVGIEHQHGGPVSFTSLPPTPLAGGTVGSAAGGAAANTANGAGPAVAAAAASALGPEVDTLPQTEDFTRVYVPKCICILSQHTFYLQFREFLTTLYRLALSGSLHSHATGSGLVSHDHGRPSVTDIHIPLERHISNFMRDVPLPPLGHVEVLYKLGMCNLYFKRAPPNRPMMFPPFPIRRIFEHMRAEHVELLLCCLLSEHKVLLVSRELSLLTMVSEIAFSLMYPFEWQHVFIPLLPRALVDILTAPMPYLIGTHIDFVKPKDLANALNSEVAIFDLDTDEVHVRSPPERFPPKERRKLLTSLEPLSKCYISPSDPRRSEIRYDEPFHFTPPPEDDRAGDQKMAEMEENDAKGAFFRLFVSLFKGFREFLIFPSEHNPVPSSSFAVDDFLRTQPSGAHAFLKGVLKTQAWQAFAELRTHPDPSTSADVQFFDESIQAKRNRSRFTKVKPTPFLSNTNTFKYVTKLVVGPDTEGLYELQMAAAAAVQARQGTPSSIPAAVPAYMTSPSTNGNGNGMPKFERFPELDPSLYSDRRYADLLDGVARGPVRRRGQAAGSALGTATQARRGVGFFSQPTSETLQQVLYSTWFLVFHAAVTARQAQREAAIAIALQAQAAAQALLQPISSSTSGRRLSGVAMHPSTSSTSVSSTAPGLTVTLPRTPRADAPPIDRAPAAGAGTTTATVIDLVTYQPLSNELQDSSVHRQQGAGAGTDGTAAKELLDVDPEVLYADASADLDDAFTVLSRMHDAHVACDDWVYRLLMEACAALGYPERVVDVLREILRSGATLGPPILQALIQVLASIGDPTLGYRAVDSLRRFGAFSHDSDSSPGWGFGLGLSRGSGSAVSSPLTQAMDEVKRNLTRGNSYISSPSPLTASTATPTPSTAAPSADGSHADAASSRAPSGSPSPSGTASLRRAGVAATTVRRGLAFETVFRGLQIKPGDTCHNSSCNYELNDREIRRGWSNNPNEYNTKCPQCGERFPASFRDDITCQYLPPCVLRKEVESLLEQHGPQYLLSAEFRTRSNVVFWNLAWHLLGMQLQIGFLLPDNLFPTGLLPQIHITSDTFSPAGGDGGAVATTPSAAAVKSVNGAEPVTAGTMDNRASTPTAASVSSGTATGPSSQSQAQTPLVSFVATAARALAATTPQRLSSDPHGHSTPMAPRPHTPVRMAPPPPEPARTPLAPYTVANQRLGQSHMVASPATPLTATTSPTASHSITVFHDALSHTGSPGSLSTSSSAELRAELQHAAGISVAAFSPQGSSFGDHQAEPDVHHAPSDAAGSALTTPVRENKSPASRAVTATHDAPPRGAAPGVYLGTPAPAADGLSALKASRLSPRPLALQEQQQQQLSSISTHSAPTTPRQPAGRPRGASAAAADITGANVNSSSRPGAATNGTADISDGDDADSIASATATCPADRSYLL